MQRKTFWRVTIMSKRSSQYKGTPRDSSRKHEVRELAHMHNMEQRGIKYPSAINIHNLADLMQALMVHFNKSIQSIQYHAHLNGDSLSEEAAAKLAEDLKDVHKQAEYAASLLKKRYFNQEVGSCYDPHQGKRECLRRLRRQFGHVWLGHVRYMWPVAAETLEAAGMVEPPYGGDDDDQNHSFVKPWKTGVRDTVEMIRLVQ
jgi:hypothetical protein